jgi:hypothetical protein
MNDFPGLSNPSDISLLLRAYAEQRFLVSELIPALRELERPGSVPQEELETARAYLEALWLDECERAAETDAAFIELNSWDRGPSRVLCERARRYNAAVRRLRATVDARVTRLTRGDHPPRSRQRIRSY